MSLEREVKETKAYNCVECGICTASCPVSRVNPDFSPRLMVEKLLLGSGMEIFSDRELWSCLTCRTCSVRCPSQVDYNEFTRAARVKARKAGFEGVDTHAGVLRSIMELQAKGFRPKAATWLDGGLKTAKQGHDFYFVGCLPYFDVVFTNIELKSTSIARSAVRLMNLAGIRPVVSENERCCGHDFYWSGNHEGFEKLAAFNLKLISGSKAKRVILTCPEGYHMFSEAYKARFGKLGFEVVHLTDVLLEKVKKGKLKLGRPSSALAEETLKVTLQDACRMGRMMGKTEEMRELLRLIPGVELVEMPRNRADAVCCGSSEWVSCTLCNKQIQLERLAESRDTGAKLLVTACPKCRIHLTCALYDKDRPIKIDIEDITSLLMDAAENGSGKGGKRRA
ncbi:MAG: (Fe-S)-binding protein [Candidatus Eiseniibacteriota bacterium]|nr:MAG: (Fe-S)-binding protein [Candidatus Eisenbacteria bacterium]